MTVFNHSQSSRTAIDMMEPPPKRPRLSMFNQENPGLELDAARHDNDMTLKNRFESIFFKYAQDFTGIGDEIDLITGQVVVNNGHLESMEAETDPGLNHLAGDFTSTTRSMLRAMTVTLNPDLPGPDDVLISIETIAENAALLDDMSAGESEDNLCDMSGAPSQTRSRSTSSELHADRNVTNIYPYNSDSDSLFDEDNGRSGSVDSLFDQNDEGTEIDHPDDYPPFSSHATAPLPTTANDDDDIMTRFGPHVGKEVLHLIGQRQEAHIEPAWRIPVKVDRAPLRRSTPRTMTASSTEESPEGKRNKSLWKIPRQTKKRKPNKSPSAQELREESIDPLQDDSFNDSDTSQHSQTSEGLSDSRQENENDENINQLLERISITGDCPYCNINYENKSRVMAHWDRFLKHTWKRVEKDDPHNIEVMKRVRSMAVSRIRTPTLLVCDFRTLVELHEGAEMSFEEIAESKTLKTRKTGLQLQEIYNKYRTPPAWTDAEHQDRKWTESEEIALERLCKNTLVTMATLKTSLKARHNPRHELSIGNHLAEIWLTQLGGTRTQANSKSPPAIRPAAPTAILLRQRGGSTNPGRPSKSFKIKQEDSEDELFVDN